MRDSDKDNSTEAYKEHKTSGRQGYYRQQIYELLQVHGELTDRDLMEMLAVTDPNLVRPEITRLKDEGIIISAGKVKCRISGRNVRVSKLSGRPLSERGRNPHKTRTKVTGPVRKTCEFIEATTLVPEDWKSWFWEIISDCAPFSWGDNNRTLVTASRFREWCKSSLGSEPEMEFHKEAIDKFLEMLQGLGDTYIDLEN